MPQRARSGGPNQLAALERDLQQVESASLSDMRDLWRARFGTEPPSMRSREIFRRMLAYRLQAAVHGDLSRATARKLADIDERRRRPGAKGAPQVLRFDPGTVLIREWKGCRHEVTVEVGGGFGHDGRHHKSLSEVARAITGTRWNGPLFFGLRERAKEAG